jgi:hypothetical protein
MALSICVAAANAIAQITPQFCSDFSNFADSSHFSGNRPLV